MAPRTLSSTWRRFEKLAKNYLSEKKQTKELLEELRSFTDRVNQSRVTEALEELFVHPYSGLEEATLDFFAPAEGAYPEWISSFDEERNVVLLNPIAIVRFVQECHGAVDELKTKEARASFELYRMKSFMAELGKLPSTLLFFVIVLRQVARFEHVSLVEKRGGGTEEQDDGGYMKMLWSFKELERIMRDLKGAHLRSDYGICWYESDWFDNS